LLIGILTMLFMNKKDLFEKKIVKSQIKNYFKDFEGM
jgi:hypothetical protein